MYRTHRAVPDRCGRGPESAVVVSPRGAIVVGASRRAATGVPGVGAPRLQEARLPSGSSGRAREEMYREHGTQRRHALSNINDRRGEMSPHFTHRSSSRCVWTGLPRLHRHQLAGGLNAIRANVCRHRSRAPCFRERIGWTNDDWSSSRKRSAVRRCAGVWRAAGVWLGDRDAERRVDAGVGFGDRDAERRVNAGCWHGKRGQYAKSEERRQSSNAAVLGAAA